MNHEKRKALEAAGFRIGDAAEFLGLSAAERQLVELRLRASQLVRELRESSSLSQKELANRIKSSQSRVAKMEAGATDVSLDLLLRALFEAGGDIKDLANVRHTKKTLKETSATPRRIRRPSASHPKPVLGIG